MINTDTGARSYLPQKERESDMESDGEGGRNKRPSLFRQEHKMSAC